MEPLGGLLPRRTIKRLFTVALFIGLLVLFRHLFVLLIFFVAFERMIGWVVKQLVERVHMPRKVGLLATVLVFLGALGGLIAVGVGRAIHGFFKLRETLPDRIAAFRETETFQRLHEHLPAAEKILDKAREHAAEGVHYVVGFGHLLLYALIGLILAVVYLLEKEELEHFATRVDPTTLEGTLLRWLGYVADATTVTLQFQVVVAACNAALTFPVLLLVGIPHATAFLFMIFFSGLVPVVGNFVAGGVLTVLAFQARGWLGVGIFVGLTFVLHKLESYYLNPRLASRHVHLPGFVLIISLLLFEHLFGFVGLFLSFPFLYIASKIRGEWHREDAVDPPPDATTPVVVTPDAPHP